MKKDNKILSSKEGYHTLPDGTKLKIIVEKYEKPLFPSGEPMYISRKIEYVRKGTHSTRYTDCVANLEEDELEAEVQTIIDDLKKNPDKLKSQFAPL